MGTPGKEESPASGLRDVDVGGIDLARRGVGRPGDSHYVGWIGTQPRRDRQRVAIAREPHDPQDLVRWVGRMSGAERVRKEERSRGIIRCERIRHGEPRARVREGGGRPCGWRATMDRRRDGAGGGGRGMRVSRPAASSQRQRQRSSEVGVRAAHSHCDDYTGRAKGVPAGAARWFGTDRSAAVYGGWFGSRTACRSGLGSGA
jgi:hypothetical protein